MSLEEVGKQEGGTLRLVAHNREPQGEPQPVQRQFVNFTFYGLMPSWRQLDEAAKEQARAEFHAVYQECEKELLLTSYSLVASATTSTCFSR
jgi:glutathione S-transferase